MSVEEDTGWKNRIAFPSKKKEKQEDPEDTPAYSRPVERELRAPVEPKAASAARNGKAETAKAETGKPEEERFDLGALAAAGLPKDVTPEEIAALAAAAARVKDRLAQEEKAAQSAPEMAVVSPEVSDQEVPQQPAEIKSEVQATPAPAETNIEVSSSPSATVAPEIAELTAEPAKAEAAESGNEASQHPAEVPADEPVTMAVGTHADSAAASRWTAVAVALAPEESALSLEHEMQKAYAAFAAAESGHSVVTPVVQASEQIVSNAPSVESAAPESTSSVPATAAPEAVQGLSAVASAATDAVRAAVEELQSVAATYLKHKVTPSDVPAIEPPAMEPTAEVKAAAEPVPAPTADAPVEPGPAEVAAHPVDREIEESKPAEADEPTPVAAASEASPAMAHSATPEVKAEANQESDLAATTAAAWADWKRIRETPSASDSAASPRDIAAMAAAVGAERRSEDATSGSESDPAIASIVDSVLNDLRPKIVEEISRKLGKRK
jgi:trimeric autotransporter adhesin